MNEGTMDLPAAARIGFRLLGIFYLVKGVTHLVQLVPQGGASDGFRAMLWLGSGVAFVGGSFLAFRAGVLARVVSRTQRDLSPRSVITLGLILLGTRFFLEAITELMGLQAPGSLFGEITLQARARQLLPVLVLGALATALIALARQLAARLSRQDGPLEREKMNATIATGIGLRLLGVYFLVIGIRRLAEIPSSFDLPRWFLASGAFHSLLFVCAGAILLFSARLTHRLSLGAEHDRPDHRVLSVGLILLGSWLLVGAAAELVGLAPEIRPDFFARPDDQVFPTPDRRWIAEELLPVLVRGALGVVLIARARLLTGRLLRIGDQSEPRET